MIEKKITSTETLHPGMFGVVQKCQILHQIAWITLIQVPNTHIYQQYSECIRIDRVSCFQMTSNPVEIKRIQKYLKTKKKMNEWGMK